MPLKKCRLCEAGVADLLPSSLPSLKTMASSRPPAGSDGDVAALAARADCENAAPLRVAVLNCEDAVKWADHVDVLRCAYGSPGDAWTEYRCYDGEFPSDGDLDALDAVVCPGSRHSANDDALPWVAGLLDALRRAAARTDVRLLGICFGHQAVARALGGAVGANPGGGFRYAAEAVACRGWAGGALVLLESHGECVTALPAGAACLGSSPGAAHEIVAVGETVLTLQAHPEFTPALMNARVWPAVAPRLADADAARRAVAAADVDNAAARRAIRAFLAGAAPAGS